MANYRGGTFAGTREHALTQTGSHFRRRFLLLLGALAASAAFAQESFKTQVGTAFVVAAPDYLVTALHVVKGQNEILVGPLDGRKLVKAELAAVDEANDLALLKAPVARTALKVAAWDSVPVGLEVFVMGFPQPRYLGATKKITQGIVNGQRGNDRNPHFQLSAEVQKGNSGGPALAPDGSVVGVVLAKLNALSVAEKTKDLPQNVNYALKSSVLQAFLERANVPVSVARVDLTRYQRPFEVYRQFEGSILMVLARNRPGADAATPVQPLPEPAETPAP